MSELSSAGSAVLAWASGGLLQASGWQVLAFTLLVTHITIAAVTIFLHRAQAHRALELHALPSHFFRFWLWLTTGMVTKEWVAIHRKHHAKCETDEDPHSPVAHGIRTVLLRGSELYRAEAKNAQTLAKYGHNTPDDWLERQLYSRFTWHGVALMLVVDLALFGALGLTVWAVQMLWIPITAAGIINGIGHWWGYRNFEAADASTNVSPWGLIIGGEELHNNHHTYPTSAKLSVKPFEFDIGWGYIRLMELLGMAQVRKTAAAAQAGHAQTGGRPADAGGVDRPPLRGDGQLCAPAPAGLCRRAGPPEGAGRPEHPALGRHAPGAALAAPGCREDSRGPACPGGQCLRPECGAHQAGGDARGVARPVDTHQCVG
jgi:stearoyl-CoA desaturase (delta-9 desaturase)